MQNLNDFNKLQQDKKMQKLEQIPNQKGVSEIAPSRFDKFASLVWIFILVLFFVVFSYMIIRDNTKTQNQIKANVEEALNSPRMQAYRAKEARRQREIAKQRRLRQLGIDGITKPTQKNDLLSQQIRKQETAEEEEKIESQRPQGIDYTSELAAYNARLKEVQAEEARIRRAQAEALLKQREQQRLEMERQAEEQRRLFTSEYNAEAK
ncbi:MAG: hypothetical protein J5601_03510, partial [Elusimicrobiaceae bacterium]|nr:hypothetical protein [Elusimicrobiaceae bacterium]